MVSINRVLFEILKFALLEKYDFEKKYLTHFRLALNNFNGNVSYCVCSFFI